MLSITKLKNAFQLVEKTLQLRQNERNQAFGLFLSALESLPVSDPSSFNEKVLNLPENDSLVLLSEEFAGGKLCFPSPIQSQSELDKWKHKALAQRTTAAIDGSQIEPDKNQGVFFGAIQLGWFINYHEPQRQSVKDLSFELILPPKQSDRLEFDLRKEIKQARFNGELKRAAELVQELGAEFAAESEGKFPVVFFDGSLSLSFLHNDKEKAPHLPFCLRLLAASRESCVPVLGFTENSLSFALTETLRRLRGQSERASISDASLFAQLLPAWGDRSPCFRLISDFAGDDEICFFFLRHSSQAKKPARIEIPSWVLRAGLVDELVEVILAECLVGNGYPYPIETADSVAVLQGKEREYFYDFARVSMGDNSDQSAKLKSKQSRRRAVIRT